MSGRAMHRRSMTVTITLVLAVVAGVAPSQAVEPDPSVRTASDGTTTYRDPALADESTRTVEGLLREVVTEGTAEQDPVITTDDGDVIPVDLAEDVSRTDAPVTAELVEGPALDAALNGRSGSAVQVESARVEPAAAASAVSTHRAYVAVVTNSGSGGLPASSTLEAGVDQGLAYWTTQADGAIASFTRPLATVRYSSSLDATRRCGFSDAGKLWDEAAARFPSVNFNASGNHLVVIVSDTCNGTGLGTLGSSLASGGLVTMIGSASSFPMTIGHELGHNVSLDHANFCATGCSEPTEYWNLYSVMALAAGIIDGPTFSAPSLDTVYRSQLGVTTTGEVAVVGATQSATRTLSPRGSTSGLRSLQLKVGATSYWVDYRDGTGRDAASFYPYWNGQDFGGRSFPRGVTITRQKTGSKQPTVLMAKASNVGSYQAGQTFTTGPVTVKVVSTGATAVVSAKVAGTFTTKTPTVKGVRKVGRTLRAVTGTWSPKPSFSFQWYADGKAISKATRSTFKLTKAQKGKRISVWVTGGKAGYVTAKKGSAKTGRIG